MGIELDRINVAQSLRMKDIQRAHRDWSDRTFGAVGPVGPLKHLAKEALEAADTPCDPMEYADCLFLVWDALARQEAFTLEELLDAMEIKLLELNERDYPTAQDGQPCEHIK